MKLNQDDFIMPLIPTTVLTLFGYFIAGDDSTVKTTAIMAIVIYVIVFIGMKLKK